MVSASFSFCLQVLPWVPPLTALSDRVGPEDLCAGTNPSHKNPSHFGRVYYHSNRNKGLTSDSDFRKTEFVTLPWTNALIIGACFSEHSGERLEINSRYQYLLSSSQSLRESFSNSVTFPGLPVDSFSSRPPLSQSRWRGKLLKSCNFKSSWRGDSWEWLHFQNPRLIGCECHFLCALSLLQQFL